MNKIKEEYVYIFVLGLDDIFDYVRSDIIYKNSLLNSKSTFVMVQTEEY